MNIPRHWKLLRFVSHHMIRGPVFKIEYWPGDDQWRASLHVDHWWFGSYRWHVVFLPW